MMLNPPFPIEYWLPPLIILAVILLFLSWRSSRGAGVKLRRWLLLLRGAAVLLLLLCLLNPGRWLPLQRDGKSYWALVQDESGSMAVSESNGAPSRAERSQKLSASLEDALLQRGESVRHFGFSDHLEEREIGGVAAEGKATDLAAAGVDLFQRSGASGDRISGVVVFSDGRQTLSSEREQLVLRARAFGVPVHTVAVGEAWVPTDLAMRVNRRRVIAFPGKNVQVSGVLENRNLPSGTHQVTLRDAQGKVLQQQEVQVAENGDAGVTFLLTAPEKSAELTLSVAAPEGDQRLNNQAAQVYLEVVETKTRIFIAEGAPYWDSKFLAQLLRQQDHIEVHSVYRISEDRYFRIDSGDHRPVASDTDVFPSTAEEMARYDLIVFGKEARHFLSAERIELLKAFVRDQGGAVLFARGKSYVGEFPELAAMEPVEWAGGQIAKFRLDPTADGESAGLFGQALPALGDRVWSILPELQDAQRVEKVKAFTRILATGQIGTGNRQSGFPLLMVRRYGQGTTAMVNADGLWKWDFYPDARELGNMYQEFWTQLLQWMITYSEFLPGEDYSLRISETRVLPGVPLQVSLGYRGAGEVSAPKLRLVDASGKIVQNIGSNGDNKRWKASLRVSAAGQYRMQLLNPASSEVELETRLEVLAPPAETDVLNPDPEFLSQLAEETGGKFYQNPTAEELIGLMGSLENESHRVDAGVSWDAMWMRWPVAILLILLFGGEWFLRRRHGLN